MGMRISTNISAINANRNLSTRQIRVDQNLAQLASGSRINKAADDAAGLAISERLKSGIRSVRQANRNANDGVSLVQTAEGGLNEIGNMITRLRELGIQASSDTVGDTERGFLNKEVQQLKSEIQRIASATSWGKNKLLDGSIPQFEFQVGIYNVDQEDRISMNTLMGEDTTFEATSNNASLEGLGLEGLDFEYKENAQESLSMIDEAQLIVASFRASLGALQNRLNSTIDNLSVYEENMSAANSRIRDTDIASSSSALTQNQILYQAGTAVLAQANQNNQVALKLIG